jgi:hypothetical protein
MKTKDLVWTIKDCCGLHRHAIVEIGDGCTLQVDTYDTDLYAVAAFNADGGNIKHALLSDVVVIGVTGNELDDILAVVA